MKRDFALFSRIFDNSTILINKSDFFHFAYDFLLYPTDGAKQKHTDKNGKQAHKRGHKQDLPCQFVIAFHIFGHNVATDRGR